MTRGLTDADEQGLRYERAGLLLARAEMSDEASARSSRAEASQILAGLGVEPNAVAT